MNVFLWFGAQVWTSEYANDISLNLYGKPVLIKIQVVYINMVILNCRN